jgi:sarcosine oxidase, subunit gamma
MANAWTVGGAHLSVRRLDTPLMQILRMRRPSPAALVAIAESLGFTLPLVANRAWGNSPRVMSLAPGEWMLVGNTGNAAALVNAADATVVHIADVSNGRVLYQVHGALAPTLLSKGCTLDLHPRAFGGLDHCALSVLAQVPILIDQIADDPVFHIYADASYAHHLELWFEDAMLEYRREVCA